MPSTPFSASGRAPVFELTGGALCLDFANTGRHAPPDREDLKSYGDLVEFGRATGAIREADARRLRREATASAPSARKSLEKARRLRTAIYGAFSAIAAGREPEERDLTGINDAAIEGWRSSRIVPREGGYAWAVLPGAGAPALDQTLHAVARSAADLLTSPDLASVKECALETCAWLFLDRSKNGKRRWCDMKVCGNRSKARRHYERSRSSAKKRNAEKRP